MDLYTHIWSPTLFPRGIIILKGVLTKFHFLTNFPHLEKFGNLMKDLKYEQQSILSLWGRIKLNLRQVWKTKYLSTEWVDYVEEPMKYQAQRHHLFSMDGWLEGSWGGWWGR